MTVLPGPAVMAGASLVAAVALLGNLLLSGRPMLVGVNLPSATFAEQNLPGKYGPDYFYPDDKDIDYFVRTGMNVIRVGFRWERLQPVLDAPFDHDEEQRLHDTVQAVVRRHATVVLDVHNYARYYDQIIGSAAVPEGSFVDFWGRLASQFRGNDRVIFGLMNEPYGIGASQWRRVVQAAILRIRQTGARNRILVPSSEWDGASHFVAEADVWKGLVDPADNFAFEVHQYVDSDHTGTHRECPDPVAGALALQSVTQWMRQNKRLAFLGEFGASGQKECLTALAHMLKLMRQQSDVWLGWTYFAGGRGWADDDILSIQPVSTADKPQMSLLREYLH